MAELRNDKGQFTKAWNEQHRKGAGWAIMKWIDEMVNWKSEEVRSAYLDEEKPMHQRMAAAELITAAKVNYTDGGKIDSEPGKIRERLLDRSLGRPTQSMKIERDIGPNVLELESRLRELLSQHPEAGEMLRISHPLVANRVLPEIIATQGDLAEEDDE